MNLLLEGVETPIDLIVFDCDGVLLESMAAKIEAFRQWVSAAHAEHVGAHFVYFPSEANCPLGALPTEVSDLRQLLVRRG